MASDILHMVNSLKYEYVLLMTGSVLIWQPAESDFSELRRAFSGEAGANVVVQMVSTADELLAAVADEMRDHVVLVPLSPGRGRSSGGLPVIPKLRERNPDVVAEKGDVGAASRAVQAGANDFLVLGPKLRERVATLLGKLQALLDAVRRKRQLDEYSSQLAKSLQQQWPLIGDSAAMRKLLSRIQRVAKVPRPVLIVGERGTGKELVARAIHFSGGPASRPLVTINCAAFNDALLESELFGHERGAFTGADTARRGKFELADGGTLFLDEIAHMSLPFQQKILRVVEYGAFQRVGGSDELRTTARIVAATNCNLRERIERGEFLADLYDRLSFEVLDIPPLRQRGDDVELLARHFLAQFLRETSSLTLKTFSTAALSALKCYSFPGNVRELKTIVERAAYRDSSPEITPDALGLSTDADDGHTCTGKFAEKLDTFRRQLIREAMSQAVGNQAQAARLLGLSYHQFRYYHKKSYRE
jgi:DNA-binding NtrC family response regulator